MPAPNENDLIWIRESLKRIEGRLNDEGDKRDANCDTHSSRLSSLERWRSLLIGAWIVLAMEATTALTLLGIVWKR